MKNQKGHTAKYRRDAINLLGLRTTKTTASGRTLKRRLSQAERRAIRAKMRFIKADIIRRNEGERRAAIASSKKRVAEPPTGPEHWRMLPTAGAQKEKRTAKIAAGIAETNIEDRMSLLEGLPQQIIETRLLDATRSSAASRDMKGAAKALHTLFIRDWANREERRQAIKLLAQIEQLEEEERKRRLGYY